MFGYIKPFKPEMKIREYDTFKGIYCGLCKQLSDTYGRLSSMTLSFDFTFLATVSLGFSSCDTAFCKRRCTANPFKRQTCASCSDDLSYAGATAMIMTYYKIRDDIADSRFFGKLRGYLLLPFAASARKKAAGRYPEADRAVAEAMRRQAELEHDGCPSLDRAADPSATALGAIFASISQEEKQKIILNRFGYLLGRYVYFADALDDLESDQKKGRYNPFLLRFPGVPLPEIRGHALQVLNLTIGEIAPAYELLDLRQHKEILDNVIYLGLHGEIKRMISTAENHGKKEQLHEKPL